MRQSGQASAEYVALVALVALVLAAAASVVAAPGPTSAVVGQIRLALCMAGGDLCREADAKAAGLEPCVTSERGEDREYGLAFVLREYEGRTFALRHRSDGTWELVAARRSGGTVGKGLEIRLGPVPAHAGAEAGAGTTFREGLQWDLTQAQVERLTSRLEDLGALADPRVAELYGLPAPAAEFEERGLIADFAAAVTVGAERGAADFDLGGARAELLLGRRRAAGATTWYFDASGELETALAGVELPSGGVVAEYRDGAPPALVMRRTSRAAGGLEVEHVTTLLLRTPEDRSVVRRVLSGAAASRAGAGLDARRLAARLRDDAMAERRTYRTVERQSGLSLEVAGIGFDGTRTVSARRLVSAEVIRGGRRARRLDCVGLDRS